MADYQVMQTARGKVTLWLEFFPASGSFFDVTFVRCTNVADAPATFTLINSGGTTIGQATFPPTGETRLAISPAPRVRLNADGFPDLSAYEILYSGPAW